MDLPRKKMLAYINKIILEFSPGETSLVLVPLTGDNSMIPVDVQYIKDNIIVPEYSFKAVFIIGLDDKIIVRQIWPK